jgi:hypothetical protein
MSSPPILASASSIDLLLHPSMIQEKRSSK